MAIGNPMRDGEIAIVGCEGEKARLKKAMHCKFAQTHLGGFGFAVNMALIAWSLPAFGQDSYEIQVYGSETVAPGDTMVELHSNYTIDGQRETVRGVFPSHHALHETFEITHGFTPWFETGFYVFTSIQPGHGWEWVGDHLRPRIRVPDEWHWPIGVSLSTEVGFQRRAFSEDDWSWEIRPILDKQFGPLYLAVNLTVEKSLRGLNSNRGWDFAPSAKVSYEVTKVVALGVEYYTGLGQIGHLDDWNDQQHQIFPVIDLALSPRWEFNFGVGFGLTQSTDDLLVKLILGYRF